MKTVQTIADIARLAGVSKSTVSRALNDSPLISAETKARIRAVAKEHNYQINVAASRLSRQQSRTIAFAVHAHQYNACFSVNDIFLLEILGAITNTLSNLHYDLLVANINPHDPAWPHQYLDTGRVDGFILLTSTRKEFHIDTLVKMQAPFIVWGTPLPPHSYCSVNGDNFGGGRLATTHLLQNGRRRIAFLGGPAEEAEAQRRYEGYVAALRESGQDVDATLVRHGDWSTDSGAEQMQRLLLARPDLDAVFANSDLMAVGAINALHEQGRRVPEDVAVVGYDDLSIAMFNNPPLTTISQNLPLVGKLLAQNLIQYIETGVVTNVTIPAKLVVRESA
ncbi:MAG TPA: LacI family DNA-binding transcriptional regulator [Anaerolineae bacterium]|nr:LacI family DNA-binding transcriptional regulator [Anaerolineae bacterium]HQI84802.1 LacI family DNA-binding transcriptional regulator [Anaerolineae bacterium]